MTQPRIRRAKIAELRPDPVNANAGTERGGQMVEDSLRRYGAGRSILVDRNGVAIAGNKTLEGAAAAGLEDVIIVPTDGTRLVVVQRTDLDLTTDAAAKELAIVDNRAGELGLRWDPDALTKLHADGADLSKFWTEAELGRLLDQDERTRGSAEQAPAAGAPCVCPTCGATHAKGAQP